jgi:N-acetylneuraminic acid mutarotase
LVVFGGTNGGTRMNDTWTFDGTSWTELAAATPPSPRSSPGMTALGNKIVLFGGYDGNNYLNDTWTFDGTSWTKVSVPAPPRARSYPGMVTLGNKVLLFGGYSEDPGLGSNTAPATYLNDTYLFDGNLWTPVLVPLPPPARGGASMVTLGNKVLLFGGYDGTNDLSDTWTFDGTSWTSSGATFGAPPSGRAAAILQTLGTQAVMFGGYDGASYLSDTWVGMPWSSLSVSGPPARDGACSAVLGSRLVLFGGALAPIPPATALSPTNDTWTFDGTKWTQLTLAKAPPARAVPGAAALP